MGTEIEQVAYVICGERLSRCECVLPRGHWPETPHACDEGCGGSRTYDIEGGLDIVSYPTGIGTGRATSGASLIDLTGDFPTRVQRGGIRFIPPPSISDH